MEAKRLYRLLKRLSRSILKLKGMERYRLELYDTQGKYDEAIKAFNKTIEIDPKLSNTPGEQQRLRPM